MSAVLLLDIGNSRLKWATAAALDAQPGKAQAIAHQGDPAAAVAALAAGWQGERIGSIYIAEVTGSQHAEPLTRAAVQGFGCTPLRAATSAECGGLRCAYAEPARLGIDRWLAMLALWSRSRAAFAVASAGTALTFDAVDGHGVHRGGVIAPGLSAMIEATLGRTRFAVGEFANAFTDGLGQNTEACVQQGGLHAAAGLLDRLGSRWPSERVLCGGDATTLLPHLGSVWSHEPDLVLQGLMVWARLASPG